MRACVRRPTRRLDPNQSWSAANEFGRSIGPQRARRGGPTKSGDHSHERGAGAASRVGSRPARRVPGAAGPAERPETPTRSSVAPAMDVIAAMEPTHLVWLDDADDLPLPGGGQTW